MLRSKVKNLQQWLLPADREANYLQLDARAIKAVRADETCTWFEHDIASFLQPDDGKLLLVTGAAGVGKTVLSSWIVDHILLKTAGQGAIVLNFYIREHIRTCMPSMSLILTRYRRSFIPQFIHSRHCTRYRSSASSK